MNDYVLVLGAGMVSPPAVEQLLEKNLVMLVDTKRDALRRTFDAVKSYNIDDLYMTEIDSKNPDLDELIFNANIIVSLLPKELHPGIAKLAIRYATPMVTASYVSDEMARLQSEAERREIIILNECGLDPGIDHMSAMKLFDEIHAKGGDVTSFKSYCGGLPSNPNNNPFSYQFSWRPIDVIKGIQNSADYLLNGDHRSISSGHVLDYPFDVMVPGWNNSFEGIFNRDALKYIQQYNLGEVETFIRGTLRFPGWSETLLAMDAIGLLNDETNIEGKSFREVLGVTNGDLHALEGKGDEVISRIGWLGYFSDDKVPEGLKTPVEVTAYLMEQKMQYEPGQNDMVILQHEIDARYEHGVKSLVSKLEYHGKRHTAMAATVGYTVASAAQLILDGNLDHMSGVLIPTMPEIYKPTLSKLEEKGIKFSETNGN